MANLGAAILEQVSIEEAKQFFDEHEKPAVEASARAFGVSKSAVHILVGNMERLRGKVVWVIN